MPTGEAPDAPPAIAGLDHVPIAVRDLDAAAATYRRLGFTLKPGRTHANGLRNMHAKFADGTELELIHAAGARDGLSAEYVALLEQGEGPAFVVFFAPDPDAVARRLDPSGTILRSGGGLLAFPVGDRMRHLCFGARGRSPIDRPEHFRHANGADALAAVWLAGDDLGPERELMAALGASIGVAERHVPRRVTMTVASLREGEVRFLSGDRRRLPARPIVGVTLRVRTLAPLLRLIDEGGGKAPAPVRAAGGESVFLPPELTHGVWLEFHAPRAVPNRAGPGGGG